MNKKVWIGLATVLPMNQQTVLGNNTGAYVNVLASESERMRFIEAVKSALSNLDLVLDDIEDVELFSDRVKQFEVDVDLWKLSQEAETSGEVLFADFHAFKAD